MRKASFVLAIVGGSLAVIFAIVFVFIGAAAGYAVRELSSQMPDDIIIEFEGTDWDFDSDFDGVIIGGSDGETIHIDDDGIQIGPNGDTISIDDDSIQMGMPFRFLGRMARVFLWIPAVLSAIGAALAFIGAGVLKKSNVTAGVLMLIGAIPSLFTGLGFVVFVLLILAGIFALVRDKSAQAPQPPADIPPMESPAL